MRKDMCDRDYTSLISRALDCLERIADEYIENNDAENLEVLLDELENWEFAIKDIRDKVEDALVEMGDDDGE